MLLYIYNLKKLIFYCFIVLIMDDKVLKLGLDLSEKEEELNQLNKTIDNLIKLKSIEGENESLKLIHQLSENDISEYKTQIKILEENIKSNLDEINKLRKENESLKKDKNIQKEDIENEKSLTEIKRIPKKYGINLFKRLLPSLSEELEDEKKKEEIPKNVLEEYLKKKNDYKNIFDTLISKCNNYYEEEKKEKKLVDDYMNFIDKVNNEIQNLDNNFSINNPNINLNLSDGKQIFEEICEKVENFSFALIDLKDVYFDLKTFLIFENIICNINKNFEKIDKKEYYNEYSLDKILNEIKNSIEELQSICFLADEKFNEFKNKNDLIEKQIEELKDIQKKYKNENIKRNESIRQSLSASNTVNINNGNNNAQNNFDNIPISNTLLIRPKYSKEDIYKTINLFRKEEDINSSNYPQLLEKNWHEICYVYDDYDIYDVNFILKAVGLLNNSSFQDYSFKAEINCEVELLTVNGINTNYKQTRFMVNFKINLKNLETAKIHIKYKHLKKKVYTNQTKLDYDEYYGIRSKVNNNCVGKYILILKGSFDILDFEDEFFIKNEKNKNESEYIWGGKIPPEGKITGIKFTRKKAKWNAKIYLKAYQKNAKIIDSFRYILNTIFIGGNNNLIDLKISSPQTKNISLDEENRKYIIEYEKNNKFEVTENLIFENKSKPGWNIELTDEELENEMPKEDVRDKAKLKAIAQKIIKEFDEKHKNSEFEYYDFMKIAEWVYKNIKYDFFYSGKTEYTALEIYEMKAGVCHHLTRLSNALLYSLDYKVAYVTGITAKNLTFNIRKSLHAWSIIKLGNTWYPFDSTWGIYKGKVPITHIFMDPIDSELFYLKSSCSKKDLIRDVQLFGSFIKE